jgi:putative CocE/NonD family hydrolase
MTVKNGQMFETMPGFRESMIGAGWMAFRIHPVAAIFAVPLISASDGAEKIEPVDKAWLEANYSKAEYRIPMRDGVKLFTAVFAPKDPATNYPIWLTRTPYGAGPYGADAYPDPKNAMRFYARERFIFALQDVRGRYESEGEFAQVRPLRSVKSGPEEPDESTDTWDTVDWLVKNVPNNNGKAGLSGISYPGFYAACGAVNSHPALKAISPQAPVGDWFLGDDYHENGALYLSKAFNSSICRMPLKPTHEKPSGSHIASRDGYQFYLNLGSLARPNEPALQDHPGFWNDMLAHGTYDNFWKARNPCSHMTNVHAAVLTVGGWFDAEDLYGALELYRHVESQNPGIINVLAMGPWSHGGWHSSDGEQLGPIHFDSKTALYFRQNIELPFFKHFLKGNGDFDVAEATVFETGANQWKRFDAWPPKEAVSRTLYFRADGRLSFGPPAESRNAFDEYVSDPARPVPATPLITLSMPREQTVEDQRFAATRPDVLVYQTEPLSQDVTVAGPVAPELTVSTTGTDSDWVVKLIDAYPEEERTAEPNPAATQLGGYQQLIRGGVMRGKFRNSFERPEPFRPGKPARVGWRMSDIFHTFRAGHRIMVQVQSTWFPLIDRNPQTFCDIYHATAADFKKATQRIYRTSTSPSGLKVNILTVQARSSPADSADGHRRP